LGVAKRNKIFRGRAKGVDNPLIYVGAKTGRDGIHGATMASEAFSQEAESRRPTVQVGDPFTEKLLLEACLEVMRTDCLVGIQDMGAAGLTSSAAEMAGRGEVGVELDLSRVPLREHGMTPYEILLSESQERMLLVVKKGKESRVQAIFAKWDLDAVVVGKVIEEPLFRALFRGVEVARIPVVALTSDAPLYDRPAQRPEKQDKLQELAHDDIHIPGDLTQTLKVILESPNIASKECIYSQYDYFVRSNTIVAPGADAAVIRIKGTKRALALTADGNGRYCYLDPYAGGMLTVVEAARNLACVGARPMGLTDCLNFGSPERPDVMWQFSEVVRGMRDGCLALGVPVVSGNVSFYNETDGVPIYPTPIVGMVGLLAKAESHVTPWFKSEGDLVVLLGRSREELGGSEYLAAVHGLVRGVPPSVDLDRERAVRETCLKAIERGLLLSAHDVSDGGLAVALAECCVSGPGKALGVRIDLQENTVRPDALLFGESQSRIVVSLKRKNLRRLKSIADQEGAPVQVIGKIGGSRFAIRPLVQLPVAKLRSIWAHGLERKLH
jgi:phosphoribosylformylglycinamidine synthase